MVSKPFCIGDAIYKHYNRFTSATNKYDKGEDPYKHEYVDLFPPLPTVVFALFAVIPFPISTSHVTLKRPKESECTSHRPKIQYMYCTVCR